MSLPTKDTENGQTEAFLCPKFAQTQDIGRSFLCLELNALKRYACPWLCCIFEFSYMSPQFGIDQLTQTRAKQQKDATWMQL
eukprot:scaffold120715_cov58-Attheya_sp.AAC.1